MFHRTMDGVLDFVDDLGADPTGEEPVDDALAALNSLRGDIRVAVPDGLYRLSDGVHRLTSPRNGKRFLIGEDGGAPAFKVPERHRGPWLSIEANGRMEGIDIDRTAPDSSPELRISSSREFEIADMTIYGRESLPEKTQGNGVLSIASPSGATIRLNRVRIPDGTMTVDRIGGAQPGVVVGPENQGTVILGDCQIHNCSSHGVDAARADGPVKVRGGTYKNNNRSQIRLCGPGMEVAGAAVIVDLRNSPIPTDLYSRTAGIWNEALTPRPKAQPESGGVIADTLCAVQSGPIDRLSAAYYGSPLAGGMVVEGCDMVVDVGGVPAVSVAAPERVLDDYPPQEPLGIRLTQSAFRGEARSGTAIEIEERPSSSLSLSCISRPDERRSYEMPRGSEVAGLNISGRCTGPPKTR